MGVLIILIVLVIYKIIDSNFIELERIKIKKDNKNPLNIAHLSDIHIREREELRIDKIIKEVNKINPDVITITGDLLDSVIKDESLEYFCSKIVEIAPVIAVSGNHEELYPDYNRWKLTLLKYGIKVLDNDYIEIKGTIFVGVKNEQSYNSDIVDEIDNVSSKNIVLLAHRPELFNKYCSKDNKNNPDVVLCGHAHGGQWRLFNKGLFAPQQGLFPKYTSGVYKSNSCKTKMIVSRGLGHCAIPIRFNNKFHIPIVEI